MSTFSLSLLFISPLISIAIYILLREFRDPLRGYHDNYRKQILKNRSKNVRNQLSASQMNSEAGSPKKARRYILVGLTCFSFILIAAGAKLNTLIILGLIFGIYFYWERNEEKRLNRKRLLESESEFPSIIELFAVLISSGESPSVAFGSIAAIAKGTLAGEFQEVVSLMNSGKNLTQSLEILGSRTDSATIRRFCDTLILALERGTPLSEVLQRQVQEVREQSHAALLTSAGKAEIALMIPVIFLILPVSVLFALWPSYISLGQSVGY
jgi:tight adherence protein C